MPACSRPEFAYSREDRDGIKLGDELKRIGYLGTEPVGAHKFQAMFELHIEQGPILEAEEKMIGVVTGVQGMRWYEVTVTRPGIAYRRHADAAAQERAAGRRRG